MTLMGTENVDVKMGLRAELMSEAKRLAEEFPNQSPFTQATWLAASVLEVVSRYAGLNQHIIAFYLGSFFASELAKREAVQFDVG